MKKLLSAVVVLAIMLTVCSVSVFAKDIDMPAEPDANGIYATFNGSDFGNNDGYDVAEHTEGTSLVWEEVNNEFWGLYANGIDAEKVYKVGYYMTITDVKDGSEGWSFRVFNRGDYYIHKSNNEIFGADALAEASEDEPLKVVVVLVTKGINREFCMRPEGLSGSVDKVVIADNDYDFGAQNDGYYVCYEDVANDGGGKTNAPAADTWTASTLGPVEDEGTGDEGTGDEGTGDEGTGDEGNTDAGNGDAGSDEDNGSTNVPVTGDASAVLAILAAGAAAFGGLKLRKR